MYSSGNTDVRNCVHLFESRRTTQKMAAVTMVESTVTAE